MPLGRTKVYGQGSDTTYMPHVANIGGRSVHWGNSDNQNSKPFTGVGYNLATNEPVKRGHYLFQFPLALSDYAGAQFALAEFLIGWDASGIINASTPPPYVFEFYEVYRPVNPAACTFEHFDTTLGENGKWAAFGGLRGTDIASAPFATLTISATEAASIITQSSGKWLNLGKRFDMKALFERYAKAGKPNLTVMMVPQFAAPSNLGRILFEVEPPRSVPNELHGYLTATFTEAFPFHRRNPDGSVNRAGYLDATSPERSAHLDTGSPSPGGVGPLAQMALCNATENPVTRVACLTPQAFAESPSRRDGLVLTHVHVYNDTDTSGTGGDCRLRLAPGAGADRYEVYRTPRFGSEDPAPLESESGNAYGLYAADEHFLYAGKRVCTVYKEHWAVVPIPAATDVTVDVLGERRPAGYSPEAIDYHEVAPAAAGDRNAPDDSRWVPTSHCEYQQLRASSFVANYSAAPEGNVARRWFPVGHAAGHFHPGDPAVVFDGVNSEVITIRAVTARDDVDPAHRDCVVASTTTAHAYLSDTVIAVGPYAASLVGRDRSLLAQPASQGATSITLATPLRAGQGSVAIYNRADLTKVELRTYTQTGARLDFAEGESLTYGYTAGDEVFVVEDDSWFPVFARLVAPDDATPAELVALVRSTRIQRR